MNPSEALRDAGIELPAVARPIGSYVPARRCGDWIVTSGQLPLRDGKLVRAGKVPGDMTLDEAAGAARQAALNALAAAAEVAGGVDALGGVVRVGVFVNSSPGFTQQPKVANGASDVLASVFGDAGRHARAAVGVSELPLNAPVEVEVWFEVR
jgi:enamine deaminase RidA (YjgF/YER057c/UK114 family)